MYKTFSKSILLLILCFGITQLKAQKITITESMIVSESGNSYSHPDNLADEQSLVPNSPSGLPSGYCAANCPLVGNGWSTWFADNAILTLPSVTTITSLHLFDGYGTPIMEIEYDSGNGTWVNLSNFSLSGYSEWRSVPISGGSISAKRLRFKKTDHTNSVWEIALYGSSSGGCSGNLAIGSIPTTQTEATVNWSGVSNANDYTVEWTLNGAPIGSITENNSPYTITGLLPNTTYNVCVTANCSGGQSNVDCENFTTQSSTSGNIVIDVYPNNVKHSMNSHVIGINRNAVKGDGDATGGLFEDMIDDYKNVDPIFGTGRKLYRLGGSHIDGNVCQAYGVTLDGYFFDQWFGDTGFYPYDDIEYFIQEAEDMDADMIVGVNFGSGTPQLAKDLVNYLKNHPSGNLLDKVAFFELGNEISGDWQNGHYTKACDGEQYAINALPFINAMKDADSDVKIAIPMADTYSFGWYGSGHIDDECGMGYDTCTSNPNNWLFNIDKAVEILGDNIDYISFHGYSPWPLFQPAKASCNNADYSNVNEMGKRLLAAAPYGTNFIESQVRVQLENSKAAHGVTKDIKFANTEYFSHVTDKLPDGFTIEPTGDALKHSISEAIFSADGMLNAFKYDYACATNFSFYHCNASHATPATDAFPCDDFPSNLLFEITNGGGSYQPKPSFKVHELLAENLGIEVLEDQIANNPTYNYNACSDAGTSVSYEKLGILSTKAADGSLYLLILNRGDSDQAVEIDPNMSSYAAAEMKRIYGTNYSDKNPVYQSTYSTISDLNSVIIKKLSINIIKISSFATNPTCSDGIQNQGETDIDCGGPNCNPCGGGACDDFTDCAGVTITVCPGNIAATITGSNVEYVKVMQTNWSTQGYICAAWINPTCSGTQDLDVPTGSYYIQVKYDDGTTCEIYNGINAFTSIDNTNEASESNSLTGLNELLEDDVKIYPNPANHQLFVSLKELAGRKGDLKVFNTYGAVVQVFNLERLNSRLLNIDLQNYVDGVYFININVENQRNITKKFIVSKY